MAGSRRQQPTPAPPPSPTQAAIINLTTLGLEITFFFMEFVFGLTICKDALRSIYETINGQPIPTYNLMFSHLAATTMIISWLMWRHANKIGIHVSRLFQLMGLDKVSFTSFGAWVLFIHTIGAIVMVAAQLLTDRWLYSWSNWYKDGTWDRVMIIEMLVLAPWREEVVFRGLLYSIIYHRIGSPTPKDKLKCAVGAGVVFGLVHLLNLFGSRYSPSYIVLQVLLGILIGTFYSLRYAHTQSLTETLILHTCNNLTSSFLPLDTQFNIWDPLIGLPLLETIIVYIILIWWSWKILRDAGDVPHKIEVEPSQTSVNTTTTTTTTSTTTTTTIAATSNGTSTDTTPTISKLSTGPTKRNKQNKKNES